MLEVTPSLAVAAEDLVRRVDVSDGGLEHTRAAVTAELARAQGRLDPGAGVMVQVVWLDAGSRRPGRLLVVVHHLAVDGVSWRVLLPDLRSAWDAVLAGQVVALPPRGTSFRRWAALLQAEALSPARVQELPTWQGVLDGAGSTSVGGPRESRTSPLGRSQRTTVGLSPECTAALLGPVPVVFHAGVQDVLLAAFAIAMTQWRGSDSRPGQPVVLDVEGHGRVTVNIRTRSRREDAHSIFCVWD